MADTASPSNRIVLAITGLAAIALAALSMGLIDAGFANLVGELFAGVADLMGANKDVQRVAGIAGKIVGKVVDSLWI